MNEIEQEGEHSGLFVVGIAGSAGGVSAMIELLKNAVTNLKGFEIKVGIEIEHDCVYTIATGDADFILPLTDMGHEVSLVSWAIQ